MSRVRRRRRGTAGPAQTDVAPGGLSGGFYRPLSQGDVARIVDAAAVVLERTGIEVMDSPCREVFRAAGARVDEAENRVYIGSELVEQGLKRAARRVVLAGRDPTQDLELTAAKVYMGTGGQAVKVLGLDGVVRESVLADNYHIGRLCDTLEHIHFYMRPVVARDLATEEIDINQFYACLAATTKHVMANAYLPERVAALREMAELTAGGSAALDRRPIISFSACWTVSPLRYAAETVEILDEIVRHRLPVVLSSAPQAGATSPAALAGTLAQITAEQLSGIVYVNLLNPGHPLIMGCVPAQADLRSGAFTGGSAEFALLNAACAQIAQHLGLPLYNSSGISDSKVPDAQAGAEKGLSGLAAALAGANYIHHSAGFLESLLTVAYEQYVIDNDINGVVMRMLRGIEVSDASLSLDVIDEVCKGPGHFLGHAQTLALMNSEYLYPRLMNRESSDDWEAGGGRDLREAARKRAPGAGGALARGHSARAGRGAAPAFPHPAAAGRDASGGLTGRRRGSRYRIVTGRGRAAALIAMAMDLETIEQAAAAEGLSLRGAFHPEAADGVPDLPGGQPARTLVLLGNAGPVLWSVFAAAPEFADGQADPLNRWSLRVIGGLADRFAGYAIFPFGAPPHRPFVAWAKRAEPVAESPLGMLIHPDHGLWHAYRGALALAEEIALPPRDKRPRPCEVCIDRPCLAACPVGAFGALGYDVAACVGHVASPAGADCLDLGCRARRACPVGREARYGPAQARFHMAAFLEAQRAEAAA